MFIRGVVRRMQAVPKSLAQLVIQSQRVGADDGVGGGVRRSTRFADLLRDVLTAARRRGELVREADPAELGEVLGALTMDAIDYWAAGRTRRSLAVTLRSRFALVVDQFRAPS